MTSREIVTAWSDALSNLDVDAAVACMSDDFERVGDSTNFEPIGLDRWARGAASFFGAFPDWQWDVKALHGEGDLVVGEFEERGTFTKPWMTPIGLEIQPTGISYTDRWGLWITVRDASQISAMRAYSTRNIERAFQFKEQLDEYRAATGAGW